MRLGLLRCFAFIFVFFTSTCVLLISCKFFAEIICQTINLSNFSLGEHSGNGFKVVNLIKLLLFSYFSEHYLESLYRTYVFKEEWSFLRSHY